jgi:hypothetical protein
MGDSCTCLHNDSLNRDPALKGLTSLKEVLFILGALFERPFLSRAYLNMEVPSKAHSLKRRYLNRDFLQQRLI